jgi:hypothetical protein
LQLSQDPSQARTIIKPGFIIEKAFFHSLAQLFLLINDKNNENLLHQDHKYGNAIAYLKYGTGLIKSTLSNLPYYLSLFPIFLLVWLKGLKTFRGLFVGVGLVMSLSSI